MNEFTRITTGVAIAATCPNVQPTRWVVMLNITGLSVFVQPDPDEAPCDTVARAASAVSAERSRRNVLWCVDCDEMHHAHTYLLRNMDQCAECGESDVEKGFSIDYVDRVRRCLPCDAAQRRT